MSGDPIEGMDVKYINAPKSVHTTTLAAATAASYSSDLPPPSHAKSATILCRCLYRRSQTDQNSRLALQIASCFQTHFWRRALSGRRHSVQVFAKPQPVSADQRS